MEQPTVSLWQTFKNWQCAHKSFVSTDVKSECMKTIIKGCLCFKVMWGQSLLQLFLSYLEIYVQLCQDMHFWVNTRFNYIQLFNWCTTLGYIWHKRENWKCAFGSGANTDVNLKSGHFIWKLQWVNYTECINIVPQIGKINCHALLTKHIMSDSFILKYIFPDLRALLVFCTFCVML